MDWSLIAREAQRTGLDAIVKGAFTEDSPQARAARRALAAHEPNADEMRRQIAQWTRQGLKLVTVLDEPYPVNLRRISNLPPFLFYKGEIHADDARSVAVVGTRKPTADGLRRARAMARKLALADVTVLSGLARGIDTAAHQATLQAGGRTIAVLGSGLNRIYPPENEELAEQITKHGAVVSQFWPDAPPAHYNFPRRNVVTSGLGQGTIVIEASATSGAKMQARLALEHGKQVFLLASLVRTHAWAATYAKRGAIVVDGVDDVVRAMRSVKAVQESTRERLQLTLRLA